MVKRTLDLGCGGGVRNPYSADDLFGVDIVESSNPNILQVDLVWEGLPFYENSFDFVTAYDFLEHLPMRAYVPRIGNRPAYTRNVMIELFNEIYRVLKHDGLFFIQVPMYPHNAAVQDPTHVSFWCPDTINYFSGNYFGMHDHYGHTSRFKKIKVFPHSPVQSHMTAELRADKETPEGEPYTL